MTHEQIPVQIEDVHKKVLIFYGDSVTESFVRGVKEHLKKKGLEPAGCLILPEDHYISSEDKESVIANLKEVIKKLEETT